MADTKFKRGQPRPKGAGRKKGTPNKISRTVKDNFEEVFEKMGGVEGFYKWAKKSKRNQELFYSWYSKMLPTNVSGSISATVDISGFDFGDNGNGDNGE